MDPGHERGRSSTDRPATYTIGSATLSRSCRDRKSYEAGFLDGWRDRAEYGRRARLTFDDGHELGYSTGYHDALRDEVGILLALLGRLGCDEGWIQTVADALAGDSHAAGKGWRDSCAAHERTLKARAARDEADRPTPRPGDYLGREAA